MLLPQENNWLKDVRKGDQRAYESVVDLYWPRVFRWLWAMTRNFQTAEDLAQEVFLRVWTALPNLQDVERFQGWLFRIVRNCHADHQRRCQHADQAVLPSLPRKPGPLTDLVLKENQQMFEVACARLPETLRSAFALWAEDFSHAQIGQILGLTEETARWRVFKARKHLVRAMKVDAGKKELLASRIA